MFIELGLARGTRDTETNIELGLARGTRDTSLHGTHELFGDTER